MMPRGASGALHPPQGRRMLQLIAQHHQPCSRLCRDCPAPGAISILPAPQDPWPCLGQGLAPPSSSTVPLPAGVSFLTSPTCGGGPPRALPASQCGEVVRSSRSTRTILAPSMVAAQGLFLAGCCTASSGELNCELEQGGETIYPLHPVPALALF